MTLPSFRSFSLLLLCTAALAASADGPGLSLRVSDVAAPAGSGVQINLDVTEPKPISTGRGKIRIRTAHAGGVAVDAESTSGLVIHDVALMNDGQDTYGVAMIDGDALTFDVVSPSSAFGTRADMPILSISAVLSSSAADGSSFALGIDPSGFRDPAGAAYPYEIQDGVLTVSSGAIAISDVTPGGLVPAGGVVHITGANFTPATRLDLNETAVAQQHFLDSAHIDVVLAQQTRMHGKRIRARNDGKNGEPKSETEFYAVEHTAAAAASSDAIFSKSVPLFSPATYTNATVALPRRASARKQRALRPSRGTSVAATRVGFALRNVGATAASVSVELLDAAGNPYAVNTISLAPERHLVRELSEVFGIVAPPSALRIRSNTPIQVLGLTADPSTGTAAALPPQ